MNEEISDVEFLMQKMKVTEDEANRMIAAGFNVKFFRYGLKDYLDKTFQTDGKLDEFKQRLDESTAKASENTDD